MIKNLRDPTVIPLDDHSTVEEWAYVPQRAGKKRIRKRFRAVNRSRGNCFFAPGVPTGIIDFCYRTVVKLNLRKRKLFFMRGVVRKDRRVLSMAVALRELDWGTGTSLIIPRRLRYRDTRTFTIEKREYELRTMELVILQGLLRLACPHKDRSWYSNRSADILARGWKTMENPDTPEVMLKS